jgi:hypothetical protein
VVDLYAEYHHPMQLALDVASIINKTKQNRFEQFQEKQLLSFSGILRHFLSFSLSSLFAISTGSKLPSDSTVARSCSLAA